MKKTRLLAIAVIIFSVFSLYSFNEIKNQNDEVYSDLLSLPKRVITYEDS
jgi:hypothetical protein